MRVCAHAHKCACSGAARRGACQFGRQDFRSHARRIWRRGGLRPSEFPELMNEFPGCPTSLLVATWPHDSPPRASSAISSTRGEVSISGSRWTHSGETLGGVRPTTGDHGGESLIAARRLEYDPAAAARMGLGVARHRKSPGQACTPLARDCCGRCAASDRSASGAPRLLESIGRRQAVERDHAARMAIRPRSTCA